MDERIWRFGMGRYRSEDHNGQGLKVPQKQPKKARLWLNDGSCIRLRPERPNHVWSYDFVESRTQDGRKFRMLNVIDEFTRECLAIRMDRKLNFTAVIDVLTDLFILRGVPGHVRSDNRPEFIPKLFGTGSMPWEQRQPSSSPAVFGRAVTAKASTRSSAPLGRLLCNRLPGNGRAAEWRDLL